MELYHTREFVVARQTIVFVTAAFLLASSAVAAPPSAPQPLSATERVDAAPITLARQFVALANATFDQQTVDSLRLVNDAQLAMVEPVALRSRIEPDLERLAAASIAVIKRYKPAILEAYAQAFAKDFKVDELRQLVTFAETPVGKRFVLESNYGDNDPGVLAVQEKLRAETEPLWQELAKIVCRERAQFRVAMGERDAKCPMA
jgi:hypothetical protein